MVGLRPFIAQRLQDRNGQLLSRHAIHFFDSKEIIKSSDLPAPSIKRRKDKLVFVHSGNVSHATQ